jgi:uncharacterized membrane protein YkvA (DUF1232 family)
MKNYFSRHYNEKTLQQKLREFSVKAGQQVVYSVLLLFYILKSPDIPFKKKASIAAALGYFILPFDVVPDLIPLIGFSDDLWILIYTLVQISTSITPEIKKQAREKMLKWFNKLDEKKLLAIEGKLNLPGER